MYVKFQAKRAEAQFEEDMKREKKSESNDLILAIQKRSAERADQMDDFIARMEAKYCKPKAAKKPKKNSK